MFETNAHCFLALFPLRGFDSLTINNVFAIFFKMSEVVGPVLPLSRHRRKISFKTVRHLESVFGLIAGTYLLRNLLVTYCRLSLGVVHQDRF